jgi:hypothetical protein
MRRARWSELVFAVAGLCLTIGLPVPPPDLDRWLILGSWCAMVVVALGLVVALRRPSRPVWSVALGLSVVADHPGHRDPRAARRGRSLLAYSRALDGAIDEAR